jgi:hypothetical protein
MGRLPQQKFPHSNFQEYSHALVDARLVELEVAIAAGVHAAADRAYRRNAAHTTAQFCTPNIRHP